MGLLLAALPAGVDPDIALFFALAQIPMYVLPALIRPLVRRLVPAGGALPAESGGEALPRS
jgi:BASS family bile acid:Na+ symporter